MNASELSFTVVHWRAILYKTVVHRGSALASSARVQAAASHGELKVVMLIADPFVGHGQSDSRFPEGQVSWVTSTAAGAIADGRRRNAVYEAGLWMLQDNWRGGVGAVLHIVHGSNTVRSTAR
jgi:hypothetical protein